MSAKAVAAGVLPQGYLEMITATSPSQINMDSALKLLPPADTDDDELLDSEEGELQQSATAEGGAGPLRLQQRLVEADEEVMMEDSQVEDMAVCTDEASAAMVVEVLMEGELGVEDTTPVFSPQQPAPAAASAAMRTPTRSPNTQAVPADAEVEAMFAVAAEEGSKTGVAEGEEASLEELDPAIDAIAAELQSMQVMHPASPGFAFAPTPATTPVSISKPAPGGKSPELGYAVRAARKGASPAGSSTPGSSVKSVPSSGGRKVGPAAASAEGLSSPGHTPYPTKGQVAAVAAKSHGSITCAQTKMAHILGPKKAAQYAAASRAMQQSVKQAAAATDPAAAVSTATAPAARPAGRVVPSRLCQPTASSLAKARPGHGSSSPAAAAGDSNSCGGSAEARPRLKSKVVVHNTSQTTAGEPSLKSLKAQHKLLAEKARRKVEVEAAMQKTKKVTSMTAMRNSSSKVATAAESETVDFSMVAGEDDGELEVTQPLPCMDKENQVVDELVSSMAGLKVKKVASGADIPLRGVPAPKGRHTRFDEEGKPMKSPGMSKRTALRGVPLAQGKRTTFDD